MTLDQPPYTTLIVIVLLFIGLPCKDKNSGDFPDGPVVRTHSHWQRPRFRELRSHKLYSVAPPKKRKKKKKEFYMLVFQWVAFSWQVPCFWFNLDYWWDFSIISILFLGLARIKRKCEWWGLNGRGKGRKNQKDESQWPSYTTTSSSSSLLS